SNPMREDSEESPVDANTSNFENPFSAVSSGEAVPSIKPPAKAIPSSQTPSDSSQVVNTSIFPVEPVSSPIYPRQRSHKRDLVISDSEDDTSPKRARTFESPKAAMKSAPSRLIVNSPIKKALVLTRSAASISSPMMIKSSTVAKKSGSRPSNQVSPVSEGAVSEKGEPSS